MAEFSVLVNNIIKYARKPALLCERYAPIENHKQ